MSIIALTPGLTPLAVTYGKIVAIRATGLKPQTTHILKANGKDVSANCRQRYPLSKKIGQPLITGNDGIIELYYFPNLTTTFAQNSDSVVVAYGDPFDGKSTNFEENLFPWSQYSSGINFALEDPAANSKAATQSVSVPVATPVIQTPPVTASVNPVSTAPATTTKTPVGGVTEKIEILSSIVSTAATPFNETSTTYNGGSPLSAVSSFFDYIQTFYIDESSVGNASTTTLTNIVLFFERKPTKTANKSGINSPGVYISICEVNNGVPDLTRVYLESKVRVNWDNVFTSLDASASTTFQFKSPLSLKTNQYYGIVINFEDPDYSLWTASQGETLVGGGICPGTYNNGQLFRASNYLEIGSTAGVVDFFKPVSQTDLKFEVNILRLVESQQTVQPSVTVELVNDDYEFLTVKNVQAGPLGFFIVGEKVYQDFGNTSANVTYYKPGNITINNRSTKITGTGTAFINDLEVNDYIVITDGTSGNSDVRKILNIENDTTLILDETPTFSNNIGKYKLTAVGTIDYIIPSTNTVILKDSNASDRVRFISNGVNYITITAGGAGFANTDYIVFSGGTSNGIANIVTNATGNIAGINIVNTGFGFSTAPSIGYFQQNGTVRTPATSPSLTVSTGAQLKSEITLASAEINSIDDYTVDQFIPDLQVDIRGGVVTNTQFNFAYKSNNQYILSPANYAPLNLNQDIDIGNYQAKIVSKSLEVLNQSTLFDSEGKSGIVKLTFNTNNIYESPEIHVDKLNMYMFYNDINNDAANEHLNTGNAEAKHISTKISFAKDRFAEDIRVISTVYRPANTDIKVYARIHNSNDEEAFDDKEWSELELIDGGEFFSSSTDKNNYIELTHGFKQYPPEGVTINGFVSINTGNTTLIGTGTTFTSSIANGDLIRVYSPEFENVVYAVAVANTVVSDTEIQLNKIIANNSVALATLKLDRLDRKHCAFNNIQNDNVVRYYNTSMMEFDTYNTFAIKIVLLSDNTNLVPRVQDVRAIGVSV